MNKLHNAIASAYLIFAGSGTAYATDQISKADTEMWNRTSSSFLAISTPPAPWIVNAITPGGTSSANSDTNTLQFQGRGGQIFQQLSLIATPPLRHMVATL